MKRLIPLLALLTGCATTQPAARHPDCAAVEAWRGEGPSADAARQWLEVCGLDAVVAMTAAMVRHQTVSSEIEAKDSPAFAAMADDLRRFAEDNEFAFEVFGDHGAWEVRYGEGARAVGFVMHADVVPVREGDAPSKASLPTGAVPAGWTQPAFETTVVDGRLYGRGTEDDKGAIAAVLVAMQTMKAFGLTPKGQVVAIMGTGEEHDWSDMIAYAKSQPQPAHVISLDASYPLVIAESGFVAWRLRRPRTEIDGNGKAQIVDARAGQFLTQVPGEATMRIKPATGQTAAELAKIVRAVALADAADRGPPSTAEVAVDGETVLITTGGAAVHSSTSEEGRNALWALASIANRLDVAPDAIQKTLHLLAERFDGDHYGEKLGLAHEHPVMGKLAVIPTLLRVEDGAVTLSVNMRRPQGPGAPAFSKMLDASLARIKTDIDPAFEEIVDKRYVGEPAIVDQQGALIKSLMAIYRRHTGDQTSKPKSIRGGTYARLFPGAVSFGPSMPGKPYRGHAPDEYIELDTLEKMLLMVFDAAVELSGVTSDPGP